MLLFILLISITSTDASRILNEKKVDFLRGNNYEHLLLQSLQRNQVPTPTPNPGTNARTQITSQVGQRNFAGRKEFVHPHTHNEYPQTKIALGLA